MEPFIIFFKGRQIFVDRIIGDAHYEFFRITHQGWSATFRTDRPFWMKKKLKHRKWKWELIEGKFSHHSNMEDIIQTLETELRKIAEF